MYKRQVLSGAKFSLIKGSEIIGEYTTDNKGQIFIPNLYQYVTSKNTSAKYKLRETVAPEGYARIADIEFKVTEVDGKLEFQEENENKKSYTVDGNTIKLIIEDSPSFKLVKQDGTTKEFLPGVKFAIYNVEEDVYKRQT